MVLSSPDAPDPPLPSPPMLWGCCFTLAGAGSSVVWRLLRRVATGRASGGVPLFDQVASFSGAGFGVAFSATVSARVAAVAAAAAAPQSCCRAAKALIAESRQHSTLEKSQKQKKPKEKKKKEKEVCSKFIPIGVDAPLPPLPPLGFPSTSNFLRLFATISLFLSSSLSLNRTATFVFLLGLGTCNSSQKSTRQPCKRTTATDS